MSLFSRIEMALGHLKERGMVVVCDDEGRENEGDLICLAQDVTPEQINFMVTHGRGLVCLALDPKIVDHLRIPLMVDLAKDRAALSTAFTVSIEAKNGVTTGISAFDRAHTIQTAINPQTQCDDIVVPGHIFPLRARPGGVLERPGHTEAAVDLAKLCHKIPAGVICEILNEDGSMARRSDLLGFCRKFSLPMITIEEIKEYRLEVNSF